ncbi:MAG: Rid family detoxifying hydrolase [Caldilineaceae bacterium]|nr:Rid family detoxifying hydrolase [Caldilineaceae bacterium]
MMRKAIRSDQAPKPRGPYTPAIIASGPMVYLSSQGPIDPATDQPRGGSFTDQARQVFDNVSALLTAAGTSWAHVVKVTVYLADFDNFAEMNAVYEGYISEPYPARTTVRSQIGQSAIAVDCIAVVPEG